MLLCRRCRCLPSIVWSPSMLTASHTLKVRVTHLHPHVRIVSIGHRKNVARQDGRQTACTWLWAKRFIGVQNRRLPPRVEKKPAARCGELVCDGPMGRDRSTLCRTSHTASSGAATAISGRPDASSTGRGFCFLLGVDPLAQPIRQVGQLHSSNDLVAISRRLVLVCVRRPLLNRGFHERCPTGRELNLGWTDPPLELLHPPPSTLPLEGPGAAR